MTSHHHSSVIAHVYKISAHYFERWQRSAGYFIIFSIAFINTEEGSRNPLRTSTWCGLVGTNGRCAPLLSAKVGICQLKISIGTRKSTLTATKHQDNSLSDIRLQDSTRTNDEVRRGFLAKTSPILHTMCPGWH